MSDTLVLAPDYQPVNYLPLSTIDWQTAIKLFFLDKIQVLEWYDDWTVRSAKLEMRVPAVAVTKKGFGKNGGMRFSRQNLYLRDVFTCQYCGDTFGHRDLTIDHVIPRAQGGTTVWENCVTACKDCNSAKGNKIWRPNKAPVKPNYWALVNSVKSTYRSVRHPSWNVYLGLKKGARQSYKAS
jgi:5-methylcytosine-specific restriction endonuclease McrA